MHASHGEMVRALAKPGESILQEMTPEQAHLLHMAVGIAGEAGELLDAIKKHVIYQKPLDIEHVMEELGDIEFYLEGLRQGAGIDRQVVLAGNEAKLAVRYRGSYSNEAAQTRADKQ